MSNDRANFPEVKMLRLSKGTLERIKKQSGNANRYIRDAIDAKLEYDELMKKNY